MAGRVGIVHMIAYMHIYMDMLYNCVCTYIYIHILRIGGYLPDYVLMFSCVQ